jgi:hypothetical protein
MNANNVAVINQRTSQIVMFTTFWNLEQLIEANKSTFDRHLVKLFSGHYNHIEIEAIAELFQTGYPIKPWFFRPLFWDFGDYQYRPELESMFFNGLDIQHSRDFVKILAGSTDDRLDLTVSSDHSRKLPKAEYYRRCCRHRVCLGAPGIRDMCNRDVEYFKMGIPMIRPRFSSKLLVEIPDDVYFPVDCEVYGTLNHRLAGMPLDHQKLAEAVLAKFLEVVGDPERLWQVSKRAQQFYQSFLNDRHIIDRSVDLLDSSWSDKKLMDKE